MIAGGSILRQTGKVRLPLYSGARFGAAAGMTGPLGVIMTWGWGACCTICSRTVGVRDAKERRLLVRKDFR